MSASLVDVRVVVAERRLERRLVLEPKQVPAGVVAVPAPGRQPEGADDGVEPEGLEEGGLLDVAEKAVLLGGRQARERGARRDHRGAAIQVRQTEGIDRFLR